jgi:DNA-binding NarL/FixJ family response regulator
MSIRCLIVDDKSSFRHEMRGLLEEQGIDVVGGAASGAEALEQVAELGPDVALIDLDLGEESGLALGRRITQIAGGAVPKVILISTHDERAFAELIEQSSAPGFLSKTELSATAIRRMLASATSQRTASDDEAMHDTLGVTEPDYRHIYHDRVTEHGGTVDAGQLIAPTVQLRVEGEVVDEGSAVLGHPANPLRGSRTPFRATACRSRLEA